MSEHEIKPKKKINSVDEIIKNYGGDIGP